jgi:hypothetical protein
MTVRPKATETNGMWTTLVGRLGQWYSTFFLPVPLEKTSPLNFVPPKLLVQDFIVE